MIEQFINFVIRPPRAEYNPDQYLWEKEFTLAGKTYQRQDLELENARGHTLQCSHYLPSPLPEDTSLPCVIYCHGNSGCRADANEAAVVLLPSNITVFTLDFSGSGLSDGDHVSLGWHEKEDLKVVVSHLRSNKQVSGIGLWGRSMGAVTSLLYGAEDPSIAGMVLDSAFSNLYDLMMELADVYNIRLPKFTVKMAVHYMRRVIEKRAKFDIMDLNCLQVAPKTFIPVLFGHAKDDQFVQPRHSDLISESYAGEKNIIKFDGDHNSSRPQSFYDSVSIFFYNVLRPPHVSKARKLEKYYNLGSLRIGSDESLLYEILASLQSPTTNAASSSSALPSILTEASVSKLLSEVAPVTAAESMIREVMNGYNEPIHDELAYAKNEPNGLTEECYSCASSTRESWGRCSSLALSDEESFPEFRDDDNNSEAFATPRGSMREQSSDSKEGGKNQKKKTKKIKSDRFERLESLSRRLRCCLLRGSGHRRHKSLS
ncbi:putative serine aminopeptidase, S33, alpha/Beta hydrolase [Lupinus albus]|uniref:Putative serine aminopeptidase, S33, alpha/Beta hydrolase n=1 Tax=Lupinus albus TaxID=3870 RepID=A0A6A4PE46_LUPAL|nr:putative serine aminopeptidase, S33, alpha/Beta hydrolase [Lupinus albus]